MRKILSLLLVISAFFCFLSAGTANASIIWAYGVDQSDGWFDAEKDSVTIDDNNMCWAAAASNILIWGGWDAGFTSEDEIFNFFVDEDPLDSGSWMEYAWKFWFDGTQFSGHFSGSSHGGFYSTDAFNNAYLEYMDPGFSLMVNASELLRKDYGVAFGIFGPSMGHALTLWGIDPVDTYHYTVYVTDSDDDKNGADPRPNKLKTYDVQWDSVEEEWYFTDIYGSDDIYINDIQALKRNVDGIKPVPEPSTVLLLGIAILGFVVFRKRLLGSILA